MILIQREIAHCPQTRLSWSPSIGPGGARFFSGSGKRAGRPAAVHIAIGIARRTPKSHIAQTTDDQFGPVRLHRLWADCALLPIRAERCQLFVESLATRGMIDLCNGVIILAR